MKYQLTIQGEPDELAAIMAAASEAKADDKVEYAVQAVEPDPEAAKKEAPKKEEPEPEPPESYVPDMDEVRERMMSLIKGGKRDEVSALLGERGVKRVTELPQGELAGFMDALGAL